MITIGLQYLDPIFFVFTRFTLSTLFLLLLIPLRGNFNSFIKMISDRFLIFVSMLNAIGYILQFIGQDYTYATNAALLINTSPVFTALTAHFVVKEKLTKSRLTAIFLSIFGVYYLITNGNMLIEPSPRVIGDLLCLLAGFSWGTYVTFSKKLTWDERDEISLLAVWFLYTALLSSPLLLFSRSSEINIVSVSVILYTVFICTITPFFLWYQALKTMGATSSSVYFLLEVIVSAIIETLFIQSIISTSLIIGGLLTALGVYLTDKLYSINPSDESSEFFRQHQNVKGEN